MSDYLPYPSRGPVYRGGRWIQPSEQREIYNKEMSDRRIQSSLDHWEKIEASRPRNTGTECTNTEFLLWIIGFILAIVLLYYWAIWFKSGIDYMHWKNCVLNKPRKHHC
jgi:hypothetical protein